MRNLGLDIGDRRIGVAISDPEQILASPLTTIFRDDDEQTINDIVGLVKKYQIEKIVIGLPYSLSGDMGHQANKVKAFVVKLLQYTKTEIVLRDERLSTVAVERLLKEAGRKSKKQKEQCDAAVAAFILQGYLDSLKAAS